MGSRSPGVFCDLALARRLERAEAEANARFVEARAALFPQSGARWIEVAGTYAMFDGVASPCTQTFGLGIFQAASGQDLDTIETFFREREAPVFHEVSPLAHASLLPLLTQRGYVPCELSSVMFRPLTRDLERASPRNSGLQVRVVRDAELDLWAATGARGWADAASLDTVLDLMRVSGRRAGVVAFLAELDRKAVAAGAVSIHDGVALFVGASTVPEARKQGAQLALLDARLAYAAERGCDLAMMGAAPGSASQRNAERHGFRVAYTRTKWRLVK